MGFDILNRLISRPRKSLLGLSLLVGVVALAAAACGGNQAAPEYATTAPTATPQAHSVAQPTATPTLAPTATQAPTATPAAASSANHLYFTILTEDQAGTPDGFPEYIPGNFTVPANTLVHVAIRDFDDGTATIPTGDNKVVGTTNGTVKIIHALNGDISAATDTQVVSQLPADGVAHTFTFTGPNFKLNVPIPPLSTVEFSFKTPAPGKYNWQCYATCGAGSSGWQGAMATDGYMKGVMNVTASTTPNLYFTVLTEEQAGTPDGYPEYIPGNFTVPANTVVHVELRNFDDGTSTIPAGDNKVVGTTNGTVKIIHALNGDVSAATSTEVVSQVPADGASHTFTFTGPNFKLNVPIPPLSTVEFSFKTPAPGKYNWQCYATCGAGDSGWQGAMVTDGYMKGVMTVQ